MIRALSLALVALAAAAPVAAAPCQPGTLDRYIALGSTGCEVTTESGVPVGWVRDFDFELLDVSAGLEPFTPEAIAASAWGFPHGAPIHMRFDTPEVRSAGGFIEYRIDLTAEDRSTFSALDFGLDDFPGWDGASVEADVELCIGAAFAGDACPGVLWTFSPRPYEHVDFRPTAVLGFRQTFRLSGPAVDCDGCVSGRFKWNTLTFPEPSHVVLLGTALVGFAVRLRRGR